MRKSLFFVIMLNSCSGEKASQVQSTPYVQDKSENGQKSQHQNTKLSISGNMYHEASKEQKKYALDVDFTSSTPRISLISQGIDFQNKIISKYDQTGNHIVLKIEEENKIFNLFLTISGYNLLPNHFTYSENDEKYFVLSGGLDKSQPLSAQVVERFLGGTKISTSREERLEGSNPNDLFKNAFDAPKTNTTTANTNTNTSTQSQTNTDNNCVVFNLRPTSIIGTILSTYSCVDAGFKSCLKQEGVQYFNSLSDCENAMQKDVWQSTYDVYGKYSCRRVNVPKSFGNIFHTNDACEFTIEHLPR